MAKIVENTSIIEPCTIGENVKITNCVIGPNVSVGDNSIIDNSIIKESTIGTNVKITNTNLHDSKVGDYAEIFGKNESRR